MSKSYFNTILLSLIISIIVSSCASPDHTDQQSHDTVFQPTGSLTTNSPAKQAWQLASAQQFSQADAILRQLDSNSILQTEKNADLEALQDSVYFAWASALISDLQMSAAIAAKTETSLSFMQMPSIQDNIDALEMNEQIQFWQYKAALLTTHSYKADAIKARIYIQHLQLQSDNMGDAEFISNQQQLWQLLAQLDQADIALLQQQSQTGSILNGWLQLTQITLHSSLNLDQQIDAIDAWQLQNAAHPAALIPPSEIGIIRQAHRLRPQKVAIILPMHGKYKAVGEAIRDGVLHNFYRSNYQPSLSFYSASDSDDFLSIYQSAIEDGAEWIIGPLLKSQLQALYQLDSLPVPTLALNTLNVDQTLPQGLIEYGLSSNDEIDALIPLMQSQLSQRTITLAQNTSWAKDASNYFTQQWQAHGHEHLGSFFFNNAREQSPAVEQALNIDQSKLRIRKVKWLLGSEIETQERRRQDVDGILILSKPQQAASLRPLLAFHYASNLNMYATSNIYRGYSLKTTDNDLRGIQFTDTPLTIQSAQQPIAYYGQSPLIRMYALGLDVFSITERYSLLSQLENSQFYGAAGIIEIKNQSLSRKTDYAIFRSGEVFPLAPTHNSTSAIDAQASPMP